MTMKEPDIRPLARDDAFRFGCHRRVPCFNRCCRDLNQALTPYDVLRLRQNRRVDAHEFFERYAVLYPGPATGLPVVSLRFDAHRDRMCPFVSPEGCRVYADRPTSCRLYPLVRGLRRSRKDGTLCEQYGIIHEPHCLGFEEEPRQTVRQWIADQEVADHFTMNDALMELIALKNQILPGTLTAEHQRMAAMALYEPETLCREAYAGRLTGLDDPRLPDLPEAGDAVAWLPWGLQWLRRRLFGKAG